MINFDAVDFSARRSKEVISSFDAQCTHVSCTPSGIHVDLQICTTTFMHLYSAFGIFALESRVLKNFLVSFIVVLSLLCASGPKNPSSKTAGW